jgi:DNA-binding MarR family transcriptional regulator
VASKRRGRGRGDRDRDAAEVSLGPLGGYVGFALRRIQIAVFADFIAALGELDLKPAQYSLLELVDANPGLRQWQAAAALGIQKANFVGLVRKLERRSLLQRRRSDADRRSYALHLQPGGRRLLAAARALHDEHESRLAARLGSGGRERLLLLLRRLAAGVESGALGGGRAASL